jgi:MFS family permease
MLLRSAASFVPGAPWRVALCGLLALAVAMGIGRFAFTPLLPMMLADQVIALPAASWLATANYLGYLVGALLCMVQPWLWRRSAWLTKAGGGTLVRLGLLATVVLTLGMALPAPAIWGLLRFLAGVASAVVFVYTSGWCLSRLALLGRPALGGIIYAGPGLGITISGLAVSSMIAWGWSAAEGWLVFGALAALLSLLIWAHFSPVAGAAGNARVPVSPAPPQPGLSLSKLVFALAYGLSGFGYIISATFLPVIARGVLPGSVWLDLFWPIFGLGVASGALLATQVALRFDFRNLLASCYLLQALGIAISLLSPTLTGFALGSLLLGLPFTAITLFAMQEARRLYPLAPASFMGLLTAAYGLGQIAGPLLVTLLLEHSATAQEGFDWALKIAAGTLILGAMVHLSLSRLSPVRPAVDVCAD